MSLWRDFSFFFTSRVNQTGSSVNLVDDSWAEIAELCRIQQNLDANAMRSKQL